MASSAPYSQTPSAYVPLSMWKIKFHTHTKQQENYNSVNMNVYTFGKKTGRQNNLQRTITITLWRQSSPKFFLGEFLCAKFISKYVNCSTLSMDSLRIFLLLFCPAFCSDSVQRYQTSSRWVYSKVYLEFT